MPYEIQTPILMESVEFARTAANGVLNGTLEPRMAAVAISGARALQGAVNTDIRARLAAPKIRRVEAMESKGQ